MNSSNIKKLFLVYFPISLTSALILYPEENLPPPTFYKTSSPEKKTCNTVQNIYACARAISTPAARDTPSPSRESDPFSWGASETKRER